MPTDTLLQEHTRVGTAQGSLESWEWDVLMGEARSLLDADPAELSMAGQLDLLAEIQRERARLAAFEARALVTVAGKQARSRRVVVEDRTIDVTDEVCELVAAALHRSPLVVRRQVQDARCLVMALPLTRAALERGSISAEHAMHIVRHAAELPHVALHRYEGRVLAKAPSLTPGETGSLARRVRASVDRAGEEARRQSARRHVGVRIWVEDDGLACLQARLPIADAARAHAALEAGSREVEMPCDASMGERRVAALVAALCGGPSSDTAGPSAEQGTRIELQVTVDLATLIGLADDPALVQLGTGRCEPITAAALLDLIADADVALAWRRLVTDPLTGSLLDRGRQAYRVSTSLRAFLVARDGTCRFPGCTRAARACEIDHAQSWDSGGETVRSNLGPLCTRHHLIKTHAGWRITATRPDGTTEWRGPDERSYAFHPFALWERAPRALAPGSPATGPPR